MSSASTRGKRSSLRSKPDGFGDGQSASISEDVAFLRQLVRQLEDQLRRLGSMNDALEHDLAAERARAAELERQVEQVDKQISAIGKSSSDSQVLMEKISRARSDRSELASRGRALEHRLRELMGGHGNREGQSRRLREGLTETELELESLESQFARALAMIADVKLQTGIAESERDRLRDEVRTVEEQAVGVRRERDALGVDVADSRAVLGELRRGLTSRL